MSTPDENTHSPTVDETAIDQALASLPRDDRLRLTGGADMWHTEGVEGAGIEAICVSDGPSGARGTRFTGATSVSFPCGTAMAATWNPELVGRVGEALGDESRRKGARVLLAPTVNLHRHPLGGRNFESFSEDPHLAAEMAVAYIGGVQRRGVGSCVKHFVGNDQERDRMTVSVEMDEATLRELYLAPFDAAIRRAGAWAVMSAYNRLHGTYCSENADILTTILRDEWGFDGLVMSDWFGTHSAAALGAGLDLEMPGPPQSLGSILVDDGESGAPTIDDSSIERAATAFLRLRARTAGALATAPPSAAAAEAVARDAATEAIVLLRNDGTLPVAPGVRSIAVLGPKARVPDVQGGGSAHVDPRRVVAPLEAITDRAARQDAPTDVRYEVGIEHLAPRPLSAPELVVDDGDPGLDLEYYDNTDFDGEVVHRERIPRARMFWIGSPVEGVDLPALGVRARGDVVVDRSGPWELALTNAGRARVFVDGEVVIDNRQPERGTAFFGRGSTEVTGTVELRAGDVHRVVIELTVGHLDGRTISGAELTARPPALPGARERAAYVARDADVAIVVVGRDEPDTEGADRRHLDLPEEQVALVQAVAAANPRTVVVVNTGTPATMGWVDDVAAIVQLWYPGQEGGDALAEVLFGDADASGRLPSTFPVRLEDVGTSLEPDADGRLHYAEGLFMGYRHHDAHDVAPLFCFGHGLSYTSFAYGPLTVASTTDGGARATVEVTNVGERAGTEVVQCYVRDRNGTPGRPDRELGGFRKVRLDTGERATVTVELARRAFETWDGDGHRWHLAGPSFEVLAGSSSRAIHATAPVELVDI